MEDAIHNMTFSQKNTPTFDNLNNNKISIGSLAFNARPFLIEYCLNLWCYSLIMIIKFIKMKFNMFLMEIFLICKCFNLMQI